MRNSEEKKSNRLLMSRRTFLIGSGCVVAAGAALCYINRPDFNILLPAEGSGEGVITEKIPWPATSCLNCPTRCAIKVRVVNDKAVRIVGNPLSKYSDGKTCPRSHIGLQVLYNPDRFTSPLRRTNIAKGRNVEPDFEPISWDTALNEISEKLNKISGNPQKLLLLLGLNTTSDEDLIHRFAKAYGTPNVLLKDALEDEAAITGRRMADGQYTSGYELESTNYILAFGADIIESEKPLARNMRMWGKIHGENPNRARVVVIDPRYSVTAAKADKWIPINPGTDGALAMAIANVIISEGLYDTTFINNHTSGFDAYKNLALNDYSPETVAAKTGVSADVIRRIAREFAQSRPAIAWGGTEATGWHNGSDISLAIFCLNALVGSVDIPGGVIYQEYPQYKDMPQKISGPDPNLDFHKAANLIFNNDPYPIEMAIGFNSNLIMSAPRTARWDEGLAKLPYYVHIAPALTEMAKYADIVLPACTYLEEWAYESSLPGSGFAEAKIKQPVIDPLYDSKPIADIIFNLASQLGGQVAQAFIDIGGNAEGFVKYRTETLPGITWETFKQGGVWTGPDYIYGLYNQRLNPPSGKFEFHSDNLKNLSNVKFLGGEGYPLMLTTYRPVMDMNNGNQNYPWAQEIFLVMQGFGWNNFVEINSSKARELGIEDGDMVWVMSEFGKIKARARVFEGIHPDVIAIASGQGHYYCGEWANGIGVNPNEVIGDDYDYISGQASFFNTRIRVYKA